MQTFERAQPIIYQTCLWKCEISVWTSSHSQNWASHNVDFFLKWAFRRLLCGIKRENAVKAVYKPKLELSNVYTSTDNSSLGLWTAFTVFSRFVPGSDRRNVQFFLQKFHTVHLFNRFYKHARVVRAVLTQRDDTLRSFASFLSTPVPTLLFSGSRWMAEYLPMAQW